MQNTFFKNNVYYHWLIPYDIPFDKFPQVTLASIRLRSFCCMIAMRNKLINFTYGESIPPNTDIVVIGKIGEKVGERSISWLTQISTAKNNGALVFLDYTDHHLPIDSYANSFYKKVIKLVDHCIVPSKYMGDLLRNYFSGPISVIEDPIEFLPQSIKKTVNNRINVLWFGHGSNIKFLVSFINSSKFLLNDCNLFVISSPEGINSIINTNLIKSSASQIQAAIWSVDTIFNAANFCDLCIIPSDLDNSKKMGASSNRLITSLVLGLPTAADSLPSYKEFHQFYVDIRSTTFHDLLANPLKFSHQVTAAQSLIVNRFSFQKIGNDWIELLSSKK